MHSINSSLYFSFSTLLIIFYNFLCSNYALVYAVPSEAELFLNTVNKRAEGRRFQLAKSGILTDKRAGASFQFNDDKRGGARAFQYDEKRGGAHNFVLLADKRDGAGAFEFFNNKRAGGRNFQIFESPNSEKRAGGRAFQNNDEIIQLKRAGGRVFDFDEEKTREFQFNDKRGGAHSFRQLHVDNSEFNKRGGARKFAADNLLDKRIIIPESTSSAEKRAGARPFFGNYGWKRGGGRYFSPYANLYSSGFNNDFGESLFGFDKRGGGHYFSKFYPISVSSIEDKRSLIEGNSLNNYMEGNELEA